MTGAGDHGVVPALVFLNCRLSCQRDVLGRGIFRGKGHIFLYRRFGLNPRLTMTLDHGILPAFCLFARSLLWAGVFSEERAISSCTGGSDRTPAQRPEYL